ncbi:MAG: hypothetical protein VX498_03085, partial [Myxococcota bacterium]|nr:hypothetical protein [Myxococcota bacterium]
VLHATDRGFELAAAAPIQVPDDIHQVWLSAVNRVLEPFGEEGRLALELAAVLGRQVDSGEWHLLCAHRGVQIPHGLLAALADRALVRKHDASWSFAHALLRESLERTAKEAGRLEALHEACVEVLLAQGAGPIRLGRHMLLAGHPEDAMSPLLTGADIAWSRGEYGRVAELLLLRERALERSNVPANDPRWGQGWIRRARLAMRRGDVSLGYSLLRQTEKAARLHGWMAELSETLSSRAAHHAFVGETQLAIEASEEAVTLAESTGNLLLVARAYRSLGRRLVDRGELERARILVGQAREMFCALDDEIGIIQSDQVLFLVARQSGQLEEAHETLQRLLELQEGRGYRWGLASAINGMADLARYNGDLELAEHRYRRAAELFMSVSPSAAMSRSVTVNLALVLVVQERYDEAAGLLTEALTAIDDGSSISVRGFARILLACCAAGTGRWEGFDVPFLKGLSLLTRTELLDVDLAGLAEHIARLALEADQADRAVRALELATRQWRGLGREDEAERIVALRASL